jgi:hypothetical protein
MINMSGRVPKTRLQICLLKIGHVIENLGGRQARREEIQHICQSDAHAAYTGAPPALFGVNRDSVTQVSHDCVLLSVPKVPSHAGNVILYFGANAHLTFSKQRLRCLE